MLALRYQWVEHDARDPEFEQVFTDWWESERRHRCAFLAIRPDGEPVGMANALIYTRMPAPGGPSARWLYAANVFVTPALRRRGIAAALMAEIIEYARREEMVRIVLAPSEMSKPLYRSLGFRVADDLMRLDLTPV